MTPTRDHVLVRWKVFMWKAKGLVEGKDGRLRWRRNFDEAFAIVWSPVTQSGRVIDPTNAIALVAPCACRGNPACPRAKALMFAADNFDSVTVETVGKRT